MGARDLVERNVRRIRVAQGISQERLAFDAAVDRSYLGGVERGEENPTVEILERIAVTLSISIKDLFADDDIDPDDNQGLPRGRKPGKR